MLIDAGIQGMGFLGGCHSWLIHLAARQQVLAVPAGGRGSGHDESLLHQLPHDLTKRIRGAARRLRDVAVGGDAG